MKKIILLAIVVAMTLPMWALNKSAKILNNVWQGMTSKQVSILLGDPAGKSILKNGDKRHVYMLYAEDSSVKIYPYYIIFHNDSVIEKGMTNHNNTKIAPIPFAEHNNGTDTIAKKQVKDLVIAHIPSHYNLRDKIFICNQSQYPILRAVVVNGNNYSQIIGACNLLNPQDCIELADFPANSLSLLLGSDIGVKVKGIKNNHIIDIKNYPIDNIPAEQVTYDFNVFVTEQQHDLYINVSGGEKTGNDLLDF